MHDELTREDIRKMQEELDYRRLELHPGILEEVKRTRAFGDLSENYEYKAAKQAQRENVSRMRYLEGLTPLAGVMMGSRSGDIDASAVTYIMDKLGKTPQQMADYLNKESGVLGISGISSDMRDVEAAAKEGNERAKLALQMYAYRIKKYIGAYAAAMGGVDVIVWTAGVGENQTGMRAEACEGLEFLGIEIDREKNAAVRSREELISTPESKVKVYVVPTDEEIVIARDTMEIVKGL